MGNVNDGLHIPYGSIDYTPGKDKFLANDLDILEWVIFTRRAENC